MPGMDLLPFVLNEFFFFGNKLLKGLTAAELIIIAYLLLFLELISRLSGEISGNSWKKIRFSKAETIP